MAVPVVLGELGVRLAMAAVVGLAVLQHRFRVLEPPLQRVGWVVPEVRLAHQKPALVELGVQVAQPLRPVPLLRLQRVVLVASEGPGMVPGRTLVKVVLAEMLSSMVVHKAKLLAVQAVPVAHLAVVPLEREAPVALVPRLVVAVAPLAQPGQPDPECDEGRLLSTALNRPASESQSVPLRRALRRDQVRLPS